MKNFVLEIEDVDGEAEHGSWREYVIRLDSPRRTAKLICPAGVTEADFAKRVHMAVAALNGTSPTERPELPPGWRDFPPETTIDWGSLEFSDPWDSLGFHTLRYDRVEGRTREHAVAEAWRMRGEDPWIDFADAQTRRAEAAEQALAMLTAERDELARQLERTQALYFELEAETSNEAKHVAVGRVLSGLVLLPDLDDGIDLDDDGIGVWEVLRDGTSTPTAIAGYETGDQRGLVALHFAQDDESGWAGIRYASLYNELLWVRRCKPDPEPEPGQAIRVVVSRDSLAEARRERGR